jgi:NTE family protein
VPDWIAGISVGAINAAIIAGNAPERRVERLRAFWGGITAPSALWPVLYGTTLGNHRCTSSLNAIMFGQPALRAALADALGARREADQLLRHERAEGYA